MPPALIVVVSALALAGYVYGGKPAAKAVASGAHKSAHVLKMSAQKSAHVAVHVATLGKKD